MSYQPTCLVCQKVMERGFMTDSADYGKVQLPRWCPGEPQKAWLAWGEVKHSQQEAGLVVVAYRCPECAALRLYAPSAPHETP